MFSRASIKRPVTTIMVMLIVILTGIVSFFSLKLDLMPNMDIPVAIVSTTYVGAGPEEIETLVTKPLEESLGTVSNVDTIQSVSSANSSMVIVQFQDGTDIDMAAIDMREKVDMVKGRLPEDCSEPMVLKLDVNSMTGIAVGIKSESLDLNSLYALVDENIASSFEKVEGVASVSIIGGTEGEIQITVDPEKMAGYGVTESSLSSALASENLNYPTGSLKQGTRSLSVRAEGEFTSVEEIAELPISTPTGAVIHVSDIATVELTQKDMTSYALVDGQPSIILYIQKQSNANTVDVSESVAKTIEDVQKTYSQIEVSMLSDTADYITMSIDNMIETAFMAAFLAVVVIFVFLRSGKMSFIIGVSIPTSIVATFALMWSQNMTLNIISMGGLTIGIGMLVDNSIVVLENIYSKMKRGMEPKEASAEGASEVAMAVAASTLTTMGVFIPLTFVQGTMGDLFRDLSLTICFSLACSLVVSLTFVPMACSKLIDPSTIRAEHADKEEPKGILDKVLSRWGKVMTKLDSKYRSVLHFCLRNKKKVVAFTCAFFIATCATLPIVGFDLMPEMDEGSASVSIELPDGTVIEETEKVVDEVISRISDIEEIESYYATVGGGGISMTSSGTNSASITMNFVDKNERDKTSKELAMEIEDMLKSIPGCEITASASSSAMGSMGSSAITVRLKGDDSDTLRSFGYDIEELLSGVDGVRDVTNSAGDPIPEADIIIDRSRASAYGITAGQIANAVSTAINGTVATEFKTGDTEIDVRIKQSDDKIEYMQDLSSITITSPVTGTAVPLSEVADIVMGESSVSISRVDHHKYIDISAEVYGKELSVVQKDIENILKNYNVPEGCTYEYTGTMETMTESFTDLFLVLIVAILLVYMIMAAQFESFIYPLIIMFSLPIAFTGGILGLFVTGNSITVTAFMGFIMLAGMVVNNAIVLVDAANQNVSNKGMNFYDAIEAAGPDRLRPILMTTLTTVLGMVPLWLSNKEGMEMQQGMAIVIIFGLSLSTLVTLIFIPTLYVLVEKLRFRSFSKKIPFIRKRLKNKDWWIIDNQLS